MFVQANGDGEREGYQDVNLTPSDAGLLIILYAIPAVRNYRVLGGPDEAVIGTRSKPWILYGW